MLQFALGLVMAFGIGAFCRWSDIPSPAPPKLIGALLVVAMTVGFLLIDSLLAGS
jgi:XapX domain-containing protein